MSDPLLEAYDAQLREVAEVSGADSWVRVGQVVAAVFSGHLGFITYAPFDERDPIRLDALVGEALARLCRDPRVDEVDWKSRGHDALPGLEAALLRHGFVAGEPESVMIGPAEILAGDVPLPPGVRLRRIRGRDDLQRMAQMCAEASGEALPDIVDSLAASLAGGSAMEVWIAEADDQVVSAGRLEPVADTRFAGLWGGATRADWRGRGIYRALTAERARSALRLGKTLLHSDSTEFSRPILERSGLRRVTTTTPYVWRRSDAER